MSLAGYDPERRSDPSGAPRQTTVHDTKGDLT